MAHEFLRFLLSALVYGESPVGKNGGGDLSHHWSYKGEAGPGNWSMLYPTCSGSRQSPVNLRDQNIIYQDLPPFQFNNFHGHGGSFTLTNNGHTASISVVGNITVEGGALDGQYKTAELHFHWGSSNNYGSEHSINGRKYPLELHIVNYATKYGNLSNAMKYRDGLAVLGTFYDVILENPYFRPIEEGLRVAQYAGNFTELRPVNLMGLLPRDTTRYYRYYGSLTTPPCFQSVMWTLFEDIQHVSPYQIALLRQLYESNHDSHGDGSHHGGHGLNNHHGPIKQHFPYPEYLMDNYRPIQPDFDRVINCNIPRYADPNFIKRSRQQASNSPPQYDFIAQKIQQVNADALLNKTLHKWLRSKGLSTNILAPEQVPVQANPVVLDHAMSAQTNHAPRRPDQLDLQVIGTHRIGPNGEQVSEIQVQVDSASGISQEQLQMLLEDPAIMEQISQIVNSQGTNNHIHEIVISPNPQGNQAPGTQQNFQNGHQFNNQRQGHVNTQQQTGAASHGSPQASSQTAPQGPTVFKTHMSSSKSHVKRSLHSYAHNFLTLAKGFTDASIPNNEHLTSKIYAVSLRFVNPSSLTAPSLSVHRDVPSSLHQTTEHSSRSPARTPDSPFTKSMPTAKLPHFLYDVLESAAGVAKGTSKRRIEEIGSTQVINPAFGRRKENDTPLFPGVGGDKTALNSKLQTTNKLFNSEVQQDDIPARSYGKLKYDRMSAFQDKKDSASFKLAKERRNVHYRLKRALPTNAKTSVLNAIKNFVDPVKSAMPDIGNIVQSQPIDPLLSIVLDAPAIKGTKSEANSPKAGVSTPGIQIKTPLSVDPQLQNVKATNKLSSKSSQTAAASQLSGAAETSTSTNATSAVVNPFTSSPQLDALQSNTIVLDATLPVDTKQGTTPSPVHTTSHAAVITASQSNGGIEKVSLKNTFSSKAVESPNVMTKSNVINVSDPKSVNGVQSSSKETILSTGTSPENKTNMSSGVTQVIVETGGATTQDRTQYSATTPATGSLAGANSVTIAQYQRSEKTSTSQNAGTSVPTTISYGAADPVVSTQTTATGPIATDTPPVSNSVGPHDAPTPADSILQSQNSATGIGNVGSTPTGSSVGTMTDRTAITETQTRGTQPNGNVNVNSVGKHRSVSVATYQQPNTGPSPYLSSEKLGPATPATGAQTGSETTSHSQGSGNVVTGGSSVTGISPNPPKDLHGSKPSPNSIVPVDTQTGKTAAGSKNPMATKTYDAPPQVYSMQAGTFTVTGPQGNRNNNVVYITETAGRGIQAGNVNMGATGSNSVVYVADTAGTGAQAQIIGNVGTTGSSGVVYVTDTAGTGAQRKLSGNVGTTGSNSVVYVTDTAGTGAQTQISGNVGTTGSNVGAYVAETAGAGNKAQMSVNMDTTGSNGVVYVADTAGTGAQAQMSGNVGTTGSSGVVYVPDTAGTGAQTQISGNVGSSFVYVADTAGTGAQTQMSGNVGTTRSSGVVYVPDTAGTGAQTQISGNVGSSVVYVADTAGTGAQTQMSGNVGTTGSNSVGYVPETAGPGAAVSGGAMVHDSSIPSINNGQKSSAPFDAQGYFDVNLARNKRGWSLHSMNKKINKPTTNEYSESYTVNSGAFDMSLLGSASTADLMEALDSSPKTYHHNKQDGTGSGSHLQPAPGETMVRTLDINQPSLGGESNIFQDMSSTRGSLGADSSSFHSFDPSLSEQVYELPPTPGGSASFKTMAEAMKFVQSNNGQLGSVNIENGLSSGENNFLHGFETPPSQQPPFEPSMGAPVQSMPPTQSGSASFKTMAEAMKFVQSNNGQLGSVNIENGLSSGENNFLHGFETPPSQQPSFEPSMGAPVQSMPPTQSGSASFKTMAEAMKFVQSNNGQLGSVNVDNSFPSGGDNFVQGSPSQQTSFESMGNLFQGPGQLFPESTVNGNVLQGTEQTIPSSRNGHGIQSFGNDFIGPLGVASQSQNILSVQQPLEFPMRSTGSSYSDQHQSDIRPINQPFATSGSGVSPRQGIQQTSRSSFQQPSLITSSIGLNANNMRPASRGSLPTPALQINSPQGRKMQGRQRAGHEINVQFSNGVSASTSGGIVNTVPRPSARISPKPQSSPVSPSFQSDSYRMNGNGRMPGRQNLGSSFRGSRRQSLGAVQTVDNAYRSSRRSPVTQNIRSGRKIPAQANQLNDQPVDAAFRHLPGRETGINHAGSQTQNSIRTQQRRQNTQDLMNTRFSAPPNRNTPQRSSILPSNARIFSSSAPNSQAQNAKRTNQKRPINISVQVNQYNRHMKHLVNTNGAPSTPISRPSSYSSHTRHRVTVDPNGQYINRQLPVQSGRVLNTNAQRVQQIRQPVQTSYVNNNMRFNAAAANTYPVSNVNNRYHRSRPFR